MSSFICYRVAPHATFNQTRIPAPTIPQSPELWQRLAICRARLYAEYLRKIGCTTVYHEPIAS
jgi:hypothetical protein